MLTKAQRHVLERLEAGEVLHHVTGLYPYSFFAPNEKSINPRTVNRLRETGMIEAYKNAPHTLHPNYRITEAGRTALGKEGP